MHLVIEQTLLASRGLGWLGTLILGLGRVGLAFFVWDIGVKQGDIQLLGAASYAAPLLSTLVLVVAGIAPLSATLGIAAVLVTGGAMIAARASFTSTS
mgnify:FL=1